MNKKKKMKIAYNLKQGVNSEHLKWEIVFYDLTLVQMSIILLRSTRLQNAAFFKSISCLF